MYGCVWPINAKTFWHKRTKPLKNGKNSTFWQKVAETAFFGKNSRSDELLDTTLLKVTLIIFILSFVN